MHLRYDFGEKLDLSKFRKQSKLYIKPSWTTFNIYVHLFRIYFEVHKKDDIHFRVYIFDLIKDEDGNIIGSENIKVKQDCRFNQLKSIADLYETPYNIVGDFSSSKIEEVIDKMCEIIKIIHKFNSLKAFA